ncbi:MAG: YkgJ family cysteine cluster protein, partial [Pseudomonadota bacterium]
MTTQEPFDTLEGDSFSFACHPGVSCFTECCRDLNCVLTPYDLLRLKKSLGMTSSDLLDQFT